MTTSSHSALGLSEGLIILHLIKPACYKMLHRASNLDGFFGTT